MKKAARANDGDELRKEYDFARMSGGVRGKYAKRFRAGANLILLEPDVAKAFPSAKAVNETLRLVMQLTKKTAS